MPKELRKSSGKVGEHMRTPTPRLRQCMRVWGIPFDHLIGWVLSLTMLDFPYNTWCSLSK